MILLMMFFPVPVCRGVLILKSSIDINKTPDFECTSFRLFFFNCKICEKLLPTKAKKRLIHSAIFIIFLKSSVTEVWETVWLHLVFLSLWLCCATLSSVDLPWEKKYVALVRAKQSIRWETDVVQLWPGSELDFSCC